MKYKLYSFCIVLAAFLFFGIESSIAQGGPPNSMNYQAVARNTSGALISNQSITVRFTFHANSASGTIEYQETQNLTTNQFGLFNAAIGQGSVVSGSWSAISFIGADQYLQVEFDAAGGSSFVNMGTSQMLSVPYAKVADYANNSYWVNNSGFLYNTNSGNVAIGSSIPTAAKFSIFPNGSQDALDINDPIDGYAFYCTKSGSGTGFSLSKTSTTTTTPTMYLESVSYNNTLEVMNYADGNGVYAASVNGNGVVGVAGSTGSGYAGLFNGRLRGVFDRVNALSVPGDNNLSVDGYNGALYPGISLYCSQLSNAGVSLFGTTFNDLNVGDALGNGFVAVNASAFVVASDKRLKNNITTISSDYFSKYIDYIRNIQSATFWYNSESKENRAVPHIGVIAQSLPLELQAKISSSPGSKSEERLGVSLADLSGLLVVGVKALDEKQTSFETKIAEQQAEIDALKAQLTEIKMLLNKK